MPFVVCLQTWLGPLRQMFQALPRSHRAAISTVSIFAARMAAFLNALSDINDRVHPGISENRIYATSTTW
jgi:hypothetical protein